ncbi:MAG: molecular chaperone DnaJ [Sporichthyaceae bacterium]|nr:molecular chaperone DnaJ [Sporichthyaceae bacterium]
MSTKDYLEKDYYKVLGVPKDAPAADIKKAYRKLARQHHPDANKGDAAAEERFKEISEAYDVLADEKRRKEYDEARALFGSGFRYGRPGQPGQGGVHFDLGDLFGEGRGGGGAGPGGLGDLFGGIFGGRGRTTAGGARTAQRGRRGADIESEVTIAFTEAIHGATVQLRMTSDGPCQACAGTGAKAGTTPRVCPECMGSGQVAANQGGGFAFLEPCRACRGRGLVVDDPCPTCHGSGRAPSSRTMTVRIPAGVRDGQRIRLKGKGAAGERGGPSGDLYVVVHVAKHPVFGRRGDNLTVTVPVTFPEAVLGAEIKVPTLGGGPVTLRLPPSTASGRTFRVRGRGVTRSDGTKGDLLATVEVAVPEHLDDAAKAALDSYRTATEGEDPRRALMDRAGEINDA